MQAAAAARLAVALFLVAAAVAPPPAESTPIYTATTRTDKTTQDLSSPKSTSKAPSNDEPMVVFGSGRQLTVSAHRRLLDALNGKTPVTVRLPSGEEIDFACGLDCLARARSGEFRGADFIVPAEEFPCDVVNDVIETEFAQRAHLVMPNGARVPYGQFMHPGNVYHTLHHRQNFGTIAADVPEDRLQVVLGGSQRIGMKVNEAILDHHSHWKPVDVDLMIGDPVKVESYEELLRKLLEPRFMGARVRLQDGVTVPIGTYRDVVNAHRRNHGVHVIDPQDPEETRMLYSEYVKKRNPAADSGDKKARKSGDKRRRKD